MARAVHESAAKSTGGKTKSSKLVQKAAKSKPASSGVKTGKKALSKEQVDSSDDSSNETDSEEEEEAPAKPVAAKKTEKKKSSSSDKKSADKTAKKRKAKEAASGEKKIRKRQKKAKDASDAPKERKPRTQEQDDFDETELQTADNQVLDMVAPENLAYANPLIFQGEVDSHVSIKNNMLLSKMKTTPRDFLPTEARLNKLISSILKKKSLLFTEQAQKDKGDKFDPKKHTVTLRTKKGYRKGLILYLLNMGMDVARKTGTCAIASKMKTVTGASLVSVLRINDKYRDICDIDSLEKKWRKEFVPTPRRISTNTKKDGKAQDA